MRIQYRLVILFFAILFLQACTMPRLGVKSVHYDNKSRQPIQPGQFFGTYGSLDDVPYRYVVIGEVVVAPVDGPTHAENDPDYDPLEYDPIGLLRKQAKEMGGTGLVGITRGSEPDSKYVWRAIVVAK